MKTFKSRLFVLSFLFLSACMGEKEDREDRTLTKQTEDEKAPAEKSASRNLATVTRVQGLYIFIDCDPVCEYETIGTLTKKAFEEIQHPGKNIVDVLDDNTTFQNTSLPELKKQMIKAVKDSFPEANAVIFQGQLSECKAIKFIE